MSFEYVSYKVAPLNREQTISKLQKFEEIDKYRSFYKILPAVIHTSEEDRSVITDILNTACRQLLILLKGDKKPHKATLKKIVNDCMKLVLASEVKQVNKDFAYELCWYLSDIAGLDMRRTSYNHHWGYWDIVTNEVKSIGAGARVTKNKK